MYSGMLLQMLTGNVPGRAASKKDTNVLTGAANLAAEAENSLDLAEI